MRRLSSIKFGEKFIYQGKVCIIDESGEFSNRRFPVRVLSTGERFSEFGKELVEEYSEPEVVKKQEEIVSTELVEEVEAGPIFTENDTHVIDPEEYM